MPRYYVDRTERPDGNHEVHRAECGSLPQADDDVYLGEFSSYHPAVRRAKKIYPGVSRCNCCEEYGEDQ
ncbi:MAG: hypothetical protein O3B72_03970 [Proteobacteria bacterium]|nr:hypothetical protein [Pseudomonadota bacterium]